MAQEVAIRTEHLSKRYKGGVLALDDLNLEIMKGESVGYLGPNGAGKSTTIKILTTLIKPTSGKAYLNGVDVVRHPKMAMRGIGSLVEVPGLYDYLTPREMMTYVARVRGMDPGSIRHRISGILDEVKLGDWEDKKLASFSTGMSRRFSIALALLHDPEILILDEPVLGLDPVGMKEVREVIKGVQRSERTVFLSSHLLSEVQETCSTVIMLNHGKVISSGNVSDLRFTMGEQFLNVYFVRNLTGEQVGQLNALGKAEVVEAVNNFARLRFDGKPETSATLMKQLCGMGFEMTSYWATQASLEDIYVSKFRDEKGSVGGVR